MLKFLSSGLSIKLVTWHSKIVHKRVLENVTVYVTNKKTNKKISNDIFTESEMRHSVTSV